MKSSDIEAWVLRIIDQQKRGQPCEDSRVEIKAEWPDPLKTARQIAGHANAARGENILWIIGLDESSGIIGANNTELANWLPVVKTCFNGLFPEVIDLNVPVDNKIVVALLFSTDRAPFVVKNNIFGNQGSGPVELEVPWREGRSTRSARREDLIRLLVPIGHQPSIEFLDGTVTLQELHPVPNFSCCNWYITVQLYVTPFDHDRLVIPCHNCQIIIALGDERTIINKGVRLSPPWKPVSTPQHIFDNGEVDSITISSTSSEAIVDGPGRLNVSAFVEAARPKSITAPEIMIAIKMHPVNAEKPLIIETNLRRSEQSSTEKLVAKWEYVKD